MDVINDDRYREIYVVHRHYNIFNKQQTAFFQLFYLYTSTLSMLYDFTLILKFLN